ncbi:MAG: putative zinc-binding protein [Sedimentisphaerales bacterium]
MMNHKLQENIAFCCDCKPEDIILLPCSGGSNCGQITNHAAVSLDIEKVGRMYSLAGIAAHVDGMVESAKGAKRIVALDGCQVACAKKAVEHAGLAVTDWMCITEQGIGNNRGLLMDEEEIELITQKTRELLAKPPAYGV